MDGAVKKSPPSAFGRVNGPAYPDEIIAAVRASVGWVPIPEPDRSPAEILPPDIQSDPAAARRLLRSLR